MTNTLDERLRHDFPAAVTEKVVTPCYLLSEEVIAANCALLETVQQRTGAKILLALKAFALPALFPLIARSLHGVCASGPIEAQLGREDFGREVHTYAPAYSDEQIARIISCSDHILFNSIGQWHRHRGAIAASGRSIEVGLRVNPGHSEVEVDLYNPCLPGSRFGILASDLEGVDLRGIAGLHFHALCEQGADVLVRVLASFEKDFGYLLPQMRWVNFGGGHHITRDDYDIDLLCATVNDFRRRHGGIAVYLEPGEAVVLNGGVFVTTVLDIIHNGMDIAILDCSAETHMPDVLAMPYRPHIAGAGTPGQLAHTYRLGGISCLAGDVIGDYSFAAPLYPGDRLVLADMALYSFVKNTTFNGVELPSIYSCSPAQDRLTLIRHFGYADYRSRLA
jgi:carboxynorspermidine decarboxylase